MGGRLTESKYMEADYLKIYDLERYLFEDVCKRFHENEFIGAEDFFCIMIWKANRAKRYAADKFDKTIALDEGVRILTKKIHEALSDEEKLLVLLNARFRLPTASAILTVFYPERFTIYDSRIRKQLGIDEELAGLSNKKACEAYFKFKDRLIESTPSELSLRDKDRLLWGKSFWEDLKRGISIRFLEAKQAKA